MAFGRLHPSNQEFADRGGAWLSGGVFGMGPFRFAFVSHVLPPGWSGQAMVMARLLKCFPNAAGLLISQQGAGARGASDDGLRRMMLPAELGGRFRSRGDALGALAVVYGVLLRGWRIARAIRADSSRVVVAGTGDLIDLPSTALACALVKVPFVVYLFDDYLSQWGFAPKVQRWARLMERRFIARASAVIVPKEALAEEIRTRHGVECAVIRNPALSVAEPDALGIARRGSEVPTILYTGAVYHVNYSAFRTLIAALALLPGVGPRLDIYSAQDAKLLEREGLQGPAVHLHPHVDPGEAARLQRTADLLFMGFSFDSDVPVIVRTSAPGKLGDYLASGRPILALVPPDSFLARYLREHACGLVVDRDDPEVLANAVHRLLHEPGLAEKLVGNALERARLEFAPEVAAARFLSVLEGVR
jgi:glycosyltransferase involved in cell wall biosynthesis